MELQNSLQQLGISTKEATEGISKLSNAFMSMTQSLDADLANSIAWKIEDDTKYDWQENTGIEEKPKLKKDKKPITFHTRITLRYDEETNWQRENPVLLQGEIAVVHTARDEFFLKVGDGKRSYNFLPLIQTGYSNRILIKF